MSMVVAQNIQCWMVGSVEGSDFGLIWGTIPAYAYDWRNHKKTLQG